MDDLPPKLEKRVTTMREAGGVVPWMDAPKQHRQLEERGLVVKGRMGEQEFAVLKEVWERSICPHGRQEGHPCPHCMGVS